MGDAEGRLELLRLAREVRREDSDRRFRAASRERLRRAAETKLRTTMVGAMAAFEDVFGWLWGQGRPRGSLTREQAEMDALRDEVRRRVFDLGNSQIRAMNGEVSRYEVSWERYQYDGKGG